MATDIRDPALVESEGVRKLKEGYKYGWHDSVEYGEKPQKGVSHAVVEKISERKGEPEWMRKFRHRALDHFLRRPMPAWGADLSSIDFDNIYYYIKPTGKVDRWEDMPPEIKETWDKLGIPEAEKSYLGGVTAQYESEVVYHSTKKELEALGVIFCDMDTAVREHFDIVKEYFGKTIPPNDNKFAALNSAVWSGGSFIWVPEGVSVDVPLQAYFRINQENMGQFERTLIIVEPGGWVHYVEGCSAPVYSSDSLHSAVVEIIVKEHARC
ncbi:MAG: Fe-S cluster assembly protein SufB, partial [Candidatus Methylomirabilales bacterium]